MGAITLVVVDGSSGIADRVEALSDCMQSGFHTHVREQLLVNQGQVGVEYVKTDMDNGEEAPDALNDRRKGHNPGLDTRLLLPSPVLTGTARLFQTT